MKNKRFWILMTVMLLLIMSLTGCVPGDGKNTVDDPAGFFWGVWHGWIAPISLIVGLFKEDIRIYEIYNNGWWYDLGFYIAIISGFGGISLSRSKKKYKRH
ncbi:hypothetical protein [Paenibacillus macquariensis]|uniref:Lipoprotein n=1 Tax=Paenibacillus macquariensis TaxID=948756 RepID=A0ABY1JQV3_9BACL|nr:hypothetical protein [Paenibacillus macquariensis]MEC0092624.1 hypothetical protein [Paenibacillus macquariensis]OAB36566.1 hypothetical protein PMSM_06060 [Paenibacillus macquariensis subsp. macquariensis]SIQ62472.1 hypothetical protein SAMN05421578_10359 [Paenibacillus macquariensis]